MNYNKDTENSQLYWSQREAQIIAKTLPENHYPLNGYKLGQGLAELANRLTQATAQGADLVKEFQAFCTEFEKEGGIELNKDVHRHSPMDAVPPAKYDIYGWPGFTFADAFEEREATRYVIDELFALPSLNIVYGAPGCLKSMLMADAAVCVSTGKRWLPNLPDSDEATPFDTEKNAVMWLDYDNGTKRTHNRFEALARAYGLTPENHTEARLTYFSMPSPWLNASNGEELEDLEHRIWQLDAKFVVIDNLGTVRGDADENSADMGKVLGAFRQLAENTGAAIVIIHHQRKTSGVNSRAGESLRGHSSIEAALDSAVLVTREERSDIITVKRTKTRDVDVYPFGARFTFEHKKDCLDLHKARFFGVKADDDFDGAIDKLILDAVKADPGISQTEIVEQVRLWKTDAAINRTKRRIRTLEESGKLTRESGVKNAYKYFVASQV